MAKRLQFYKCEVCGNIVEVYDGGAGQLVCCGQPMVLLEAKTADMGLEKHVPVVESEGENVKVKVGEVPHPMEDAHHIEWIEVITKDGKCTRFLKPNAPAEATFKITDDIIEVREHCNVHGLWTKKM
ncbi:MAG TPA: desulfoferrodoxin [Candidatus Methanofastidiosa archaeon]|nr:desulfoferrodoxin [Candidatus Methanofastidiosa archaeon]HPR41392.1 desulfoferrodoxin [Candidatus Methanofastidiosa archaeon]